MTDRSGLAGLLWHGLQVFIVTLLVAGCASAFVPQATDLTFWLDVTGAAIVAALTELLTYASYRAGIPPRAPSDPAHSRPSEDAPVSTPDAAGAAQRPSQSADADPP